MLKPGTLLKVTLLHGCFSRFSNCTNGTKSCKASHIVHENMGMNGLNIQTTVQRSPQEQKNWNMILPIFLLSVLLPQPFQTPPLHVFVSQGHLLYIIYKILYNATIFQTLLKKNQLHDLEYHQPVTWSFWKKIQKLTHFKSMHLFNSINFILSATAQYISLIHFGIIAWNNISIT